MKTNHLSRLNEVWIPNPIYFLTTCTFARQPRLHNDDFLAIALEVWTNCERLYGWKVGQFVVMPDHVHFFAADSARQTTLSEFMGRWKEWTAKYCNRRLAYSTPLWQSEFFDHVIRSKEKYSETLQYLAENPIRAGLANRTEDWKYRGVIHELECE